MRPSWLIAGVVFALLHAAPPASAQESIALAVEGWRQQERDGIVYYRCASQICAAGSTVSYKQQPHRPQLTLAEFEKHHRGLVQQNSGQGSIREARFIEAKQRVVEGVRVMQIAREVDWKDKGTTFTIEARLIGPDRSFSLVSDSSRREWTANNFEGFLRRMIDIAGIKTQ